MKTLLLACFLLLSYTLRAQDDSRIGTTEYLNDKYGFRDAVLEKPFSSFVGMHFIRLGKDNTKVYARATDKLAIGQFPVKAIEYIFYKGLLYSVRILVVGDTNIEGIISAFTTLYGSPETKYNGLYRIWASNRVLLKGTVTPNKGEFEMSSGYIYSLINRDAVDAKIKESDRRQRAGERAASDL